MNKHIEGSPPMAANSGREVDQLKQFLRENTRDHLKHLAHADSAVIEEVTVQRAVLAHWISLILVSGEKIRVTFRAHFSTQDASALAARAYMVNTADLPAEQAHDFMKEFCNVCAGRLKRLLLQNSLDVGISLPFVTRGFDQIFDQPSKDKFCIEDKWHLACGEASIDCSVRIEADEPVALKNFASTESTEGQVDVL